MRPAFSSTRQMVAFAITVAILLFLPAIMGKTHTLDRKNVYPEIAWKYGPFPYIQQKIFDETGDVDVAIVGSSEIWCMIDTPYVQKKFSEHLGRDAEVFTLGWPWPGFDAAYIIARDLLERRRVKVMVIYDESRNGDASHTHASRWFLIGPDSEVLPGLPTKAQARLYAGAVLGMPRHLLSLTRPNLLEDPEQCRPNFWNTYYRAPNVALQRGALNARLAYNVSPDFVEFNASGLASPEDFRIHSDQTAGDFKFTAARPHPYQLHFVRKLAELCRKHGTRLVVLNTPSFQERNNTDIRERFNWDEILGTAADVVGIAPAKLFAGIAPDDVVRLYYEGGHFNVNGQNLYTPLITPVLLKLYDQPTENH